MKTAIDEDKKIEYERYNSMSKSKLETIAYKQYYHNNYLSELKPYLQTPYIYYENLLLEILSPKDNLLDLCCGDGIYTFPIGRIVKTITAIDIAENSIDLAKKKAKQLNIKNIQFLVSDVEKLNLGKELFDVITCVGSLSYLNINTVISVVKYHLKQGGKFIIVDSFNHNIVYRLNRYIHYLKGERSKSTLSRMPNKRTISKLKEEFQIINIEYFGIFSFIAPILEKFSTPSKTKSIIDALDKKFRFLKKYSFKIIIVTQNK